MGRYTSWDLNVHGLRGCVGFRALGISSSTWADIHHGVLKLGNYIYHAHFSLVLVPRPLGVVPLDVGL